VKYTVYLLLISALLLAVDTAADNLALPPHQKADLVLVVKSTRTLTLLNDGHAIGVFPVAFGANPVGHKQEEGDERTPEGRYTLDYKKISSEYHKAIHISYPNAQDIENAKKRGVAPGGSIMIHGQKRGFNWLSFVTQYFNWTKGCIALSNEDIDVVWNAVNVGTPIEIKP
jgi:murein L,D-transpeptidase YafK